MRAYNDINTLLSQKKKKDVNTLVFVAIYILEMRKCLLLNFDMRLDLEK